MRRLPCACLLLAFCLAGTAASAPAATSLHIAAALDRPAIAPVLAAFERAHPDIDIRYADLATRAVERRIDDTSRPPDVVISSAMPSQLAAANAGYAARLSGPTIANWPARFKWRDAVFGFTFEPVVFAYRADLLPADMNLDSHGALYRALTDRRPQFCGRVAIYDPAQSAVGYALYQADAGHTARFWQLVSAFGRARAHQLPDTRAMLTGLSEGRFVLAYNLLGAYARRYARTHPEIRIVAPTDYTLMLSRMVFVHRAAPHPDAARRFVTYLLSQQGQRVLTHQTQLAGPPRADPSAGRPSATRPADQPRIMPIALDAGLLAQVDPAQRRRDLAQWQARFAVPGQPRCRSADRVSAHAGPSR